MAEPSRDAVVDPREAYLVVAGPTAVGKSVAAVEASERLGGEIVVADSRQVYRGLDIGTAKPSRAERERVPHHLLDLVEVGEPYTAADWAADARRAIAGILRRGRVPVVCGGTGLYLEALAGGLDPIGAEVSAAERAAALRRLEAIPEAERHARLAEVDPEGAGRLHPNDRQRVDRALEVWLATGEPLSAQWRGGGEPPWPHVDVRLERPRTELHRRIEARLDRMLAAGLEAEARGFLEAGMTPSHPGLDTIGYQEWWPYFEGRIDRAEARRRILVATRRYAKRQQTWFRRRGGYRAVDASAGAEGVLERWREASAA